jgi:hypothetical protein
MNYLTKSKKLEAQPESLARAPKKTRNFLLLLYTATKLKTKRKLETLKLSTLHPVCNWKKRYMNLKIFLSLFINYVKNVNETHP